MDESHSLGLVRQPGRDPLPDRVRRGTHDEPASSVRRPGKQQISWPVTTARVVCLLATGAMSSSPLGGVVTADGERRPVVAVWSAAGALAVVIATIAAGGALQAGLAPWPGIAVVVMATAAFGAAGRRESLLVGGLLAATGVVSVGYGLVQTEFLTAATFPGPVFGVIIGLPVLGLAASVPAVTARRGGR